MAEEKRVPSRLVQFLAGAEEPPSTPWRLLSTFGLAPLLLVFFLLVTAHFAYTPDDTYIYLQYARNIAAGNGFAFNAGMPSYGVTGPLWALLIAAGTAGGLDPYVVAKVFDLMFGSMALMGTYLLAIALLRNRVYALLCAIVVGFDAWVLRWTASGMESSLAVLLVVVAIRYAYLNQYSAASIAAAALALVRPEGALLLMVIIADNFVNSRDRRRSATDALRMIAVFAILVVPWIVYAWIEFGTPVPNTFAAKAGWSLSPPELAGTAWNILKQVGATQPWTTAVAVLGTVFLIHRRGWREVRSELFPALWVVLLIVFYLAADVQVVSRYLLMAIPFLVLGAFWVLRRMAEAHILPAPVATAAAIVLCLVSVVQNQYVYDAVVVPHLRNFEEGMTSALKPMAYWLDANAAPNATVLTPDVGMLGYDSHRQMYDVGGLITPEVRRAFRGLTYDEGMMTAAYRRVVVPDFVVDRAPTAERLASPTVRPIMSRNFPGLGIARPDSVIYTLYQVMK